MQFFRTLQLCWMSEFHSPCVGVLELVVGFHSPILAIHYDIHLTRAIMPHGIIWLDHPENKPEVPQISKRKHPPPEREFLRNTFNFRCGSVHFSCSPSSIDHIHILKLLLHKQIYNEASTKLIFLLMYLWLPKLRVC